MHGTQFVESVQTALSDWWAEQEPRRPTLVSIMIRSTPDMRGSVAGAYAVGLVGRQSVGARVRFWVGSAEATM